jgi:asparagine synthase (glutamine-hydrolysing)
MAGSLRHRGPDDENFWSDPAADLGLAFRRLSIIDLEGGRQPIANENGRVVTVLNGEIYNYRELRAELVARGHRFTTQSDTEVIVHLYEDHGTDFVGKLRGMFAIALWDAESRRLLLARDRVGKKPLYYSEANDEFGFASEIKGVLAASQALAEIDPQAVVDYLTYSVVPAPETIYRDVRSVEPSELLSAKYWRLEMLPKVEVSREEAIEQVDGLLHEAVRLRLRSDVPVGCFLSGGIDSGLVTAIAAREQSEPLTTVTIGFEDGAFDERPLAKLVAQRYGTHHHEVVVRPDVVSDLPRIVAAYDQPFGDSSSIPSFYVAKAARQFVKVVLNGDGGDEVFAGYRRYVAGWMSGRLRWLDRSAMRPGWRMLHRLLPKPRGFRSAYAFGHRLVRGLALDPVPRYFAWAQDVFDEDRLSGLVGGNGAELHASGRQVRETLAGLAGCGSIDRMLAADFATILPHDLLVKMDIATMASSLEARSPLLDHVLIETVARYPERLKLDGFTTKPLLRELSKRYVPEPVQMAPKRGFEVPMVRWLRGELREMAADVVLTRSGLLADWFDREARERLLGNADGLEPARWSRQVWMLLVLGVWDREVYRTRPVKEDRRSK